MKNEMKVAAALILLLTVSFFSQIALSNKINTTKTTTQNLSLVALDCIDEVEMQYEGEPELIRELSLECVKEYLKEVK